MRLASAAPSTPAAQSITPNSDDQRHGQAAQVAPPGGIAATGGGGGGGLGRRARRRRRRRRQLRHRADRTGVHALRDDGLGTSDRPVPDSTHAAREAQLEAPLRRGRHLGAVHRVRRLRHRLPARRARLRRHRAASTSRSSSRTCGGPGDCSHGDKGCTSCTRACPRFRAWEPEIDEFLFGRARDRRGAVAASTRTSSSPAPPTRCSHEVGQDGGLVSAILAVRARARHHRRRARVATSRATAHVEGDPRRRPHREDIIASAGSRYTYSANTHGLRRRRRGRRRAHRARRHELPVVDAAGDEAAQGGQGRAAARRSTSACCARRRSTTRSSRSCSRRSTA